LQRTESEQQNHEIQHAADHPFEIDLENLCDSAVVDTDRNGRLAVVVLLR
jgi:hypothetical protein